MAMVQCKACGKIYDYEKNGCCPSCGAYNRPPRRERVDADGTVHHLTGQERRSVPHGGKVCFEKNVLVKSRRSVIVLLLLSAQKDENSKELDVFLDLFLPPGSCSLR